ncbi:MAG: NAD-dependent epimerase/dehydratase family protein [Bacteroidota bacterium]
MKIVIIGANGFIGWNMMNYFSERHYTTFGCDVSENLHGYRFYTRVQRTGTDYTPVFEQQDFDLCVNASGSSNVGKSINNPSHDYHLNTQNVFKLLEELRTTNPRCKFVNFSSAAVYGNPEALPIGEDARPNPLSPYGWHKYQSEFLCKEFHQMYGLKTVSLRVFSAYGPGMRNRLFWDIYHKSLAPGPIRLWGTGKESRDFVFSEDLCRAVEALVHNAPFKGEVVNVSSGHEHTIEEVATFFVNLLDPDREVIFGGEEKPGDPKNWRADVTLLKSYGFEPQVPIFEGLKQYQEWLIRLTEPV